MSLCDDEGCEHYATPHVCIYDNVIACSQWHETRWFFRLFGYRRYWRYFDEFGTKEWADNK